MVKHVILFGKNHNTLTVKGVNPYGQPDRKKTFFFDGSPTAEIQPFVSLKKTFLLFLTPPPHKKTDHYIRMVLLSSLMLFHYRFHSLLSGHSSAEAEKGKDTCSTSRNLCRDDDHYHYDHPASKGRTIIDDAHGGHWGFNKYQPK